MEVDGPHHFTANGQRPLGEMRARHRLLDVRGWSVLSVPHFTWTTHADDAAHIVFLRQVCACSNGVADSPCVIISSQGQQTTTCALHSSVASQDKAKNLKVVSPFIVCTAVTMLTVDNW